jgi:site-specific recombinase XerC
MVATLLSGSGLRLLECLRLRVKGIQFDRAQITVRRGKGRKDRAVPLAQVLSSPPRTPPAPASAPP